MLAYKNHQLLQIDTVATGAATIKINSIVAVDKIRITVFDDLQSQDPVIAPPGIQIWSNLVNTCIGVVATNLYQIIVGPTINCFFASGMRPLDGMEFWYPTKTVLNGNYNLVFTDLDGNIPSKYIHGSAFVLIEYFQYA